MTITEDNGVITIGNDFVDCVIGKYLTQGTLKTKSLDYANREKEYKILSTFMPSVTEHILYKYSGIKILGMTFKGIEGAY